MSLSNLKMTKIVGKSMVDVYTGGFFFPNLAVEDVSNYKLSLGHSHFDYAEALLIHTFSTAKLRKKGSTPYAIF